MLTRNRKVVLLLMLAGVVGLAVFAPDPGGRAGPSVPAAPTAKVADASLPARVAIKDDSRHAMSSEFPARGALGDPKADLFGPQSWQPPPPKVVAAPPPPPIPPPMTYRYAGRLLQDGKLLVFVSNSDRPVAVKPGDRLDGGYVVESITPTAIALVYPPLAYKASIAISPAYSTQGTAVTSNAVAPGMGSLPAPSTQARRDGAAAATPYGKPARLQWEGPAQVRLGTNFSVALRVEADQPINGSPMQLRFDPNILESVGVRPGKRYAGEAGRGFNYSMNPEDGSIRVGASSSTVSVAGDAELLILTFKPLKTGVQAEVSLTALNLQGPAGLAVAHGALATFRAPVIP